MQWITCENTYEESWRRLLEFANVELAMEAIVSLHGSGNQKNQRKQAEQARLSLLQAREYFDAAIHSSLFTQPNHLYYGMVALSTACMLIRGDGTKSLDYLRRNKGNAHHGLDFSFSSNLNQSKIGVNLLENSHVKICQNGHFSNWYDTLVSSQHILSIEKVIRGGKSATSCAEVGSFEIPKFQSLVNEKVPLIFLVKRLPDLFSDLGRYGIKVSGARGEHVLTKFIDTDEFEHEFKFHYSPTYQILMDVINNFECGSGVNFSIDINEGSTQGLVRTRRDKGWSFEFPDSRMTMDHKIFYYKETLGTPEVVDLFLISYVLSMLSRYFPDIWGSFLESHCKGAKLVERIVRLLTMKAPNLMLNQIAEDNYVISNHRPIWH